MCNMKIMKKCQSFMIVIWAVVVKNVFIVDGKMAHLLASSRPQSLSEEKDTEVLNCE